MAQAMRADFRIIGTKRRGSLVQGERRSSLAFSAKCISSFDEGARLLTHASS